MAAAAAAAAKVVVVVAAAAAVSVGLRELGPQVGEEEAVHSRACGTSQSHAALRFGSPGQVRAGSLALMLGEHLW